LSGKELRQSEDRRKKAAYAEELKRQMQEMAANKKRSALTRLLVFLLKVNTVPVLTVSHAALYMEKLLHLFFV